MKNTINVSPNRIKEAELTSIIVEYCRNAKYAAILCSGINVYIFQEFLLWRKNVSYCKNAKYAAIQISAKRGPDSRFIIEANIKAL